MKRWIPVLISLFAAQAHAQAGFLLDDASNSRISSPPARRQTPAQAASTPTSPTTTAPMPPRRPRELTNRPLLPPVPAETAPAVRPQRPEAPPVTSTPTPATAEAATPRARVATSQTVRCPEFTDTQEGATQIFNSVLGISGAFRRQFIENPPYGSFALKLTLLPGNGELNLKIETPFMNLNRAAKVCHDASNNTVQICEAGGSNCFRVRRNGEPNQIHVSGPRINNSFTAAER